MRSAAARIVDRRAHVGAAQSRRRRRGRRAPRPSPAPCAAPPWRRAGPTVSSDTSPPCASVSLSAFSSRYSSLPFASSWTDRSVSRSLPSRSVPTTGTALSRTTMFMRLSCGQVTGCAQQVAGDDQSLDLLRALVELRDLGVAHHPLDRVLGRVAVAAQHLDGVGRDGHRGVAAEELGHRRPARGVRRRPPRCRSAAAYSSWRAASVRVAMSASIAPIIWKLADRPAELLALRGVLRRDVQRALRDADGLGGDARARCARTSSSPAPSRRPPRRRGWRRGRERRRKRARRSSSRGCPSCARRVATVKPGVPFST